MFRLFRYLKPFTLAVVATVILVAVQAGTELYLPTLMADIIDKGVVKGDTVYILRIGGEYSMAPWHFRAGYLFDHTPVSDQYAEPMLPDANRNGLNLGLGYDVSDHWDVSVAYFFLKFNDRTVTTTVPEISFDGTYHTYANLFGANIEFKF